MATTGVAFADSGKASQHPDRRSQRTVVLPHFRPSAASARHVQVRFHAVGGSKVSGFVNLVQLPRTMGTHITVIAFGLKPGNEYVSLYYDNHVCALEPYSAEDVVGGIYTANAVGVGVTSGNADDNLPDINSVSVRRADFTLIACADVHP